MLSLFIKSTDSMIVRIVHGKNIYHNNVQLNQFFIHNFQNNTGILIKCTT